MERKSRYTLKDVLDSYRKYLLYQRRLQKATVEVYTHEVSIFLEFLNRNNKDLKSFDKFDCQEFLGKSSKERKLTSVSQAKLFSSLNSFVGFLILNEFRSDDPLEVISTVKINRNIPDVISQEELNKLFSKMDKIDDLSIRDRALFELIYSCGLRISEVINLTLTAYQKDYLVVTGKRNKTRYIPIGELAREKLDCYLLTVRPKLLKDRTSIIFLGRRGNPLTRQAVNHRLEIYCFESKIKIHVHTLRHCFATHLLQGGADIRIVQELLGHSDIQTTQIYTKVADKDLSDTYNKYHKNLLKEEKK